MIFSIDVNDLLNSGRRVVFTLYVYNYRPGSDCSLTPIGKIFAVVSFFEQIGREVWPSHKFFSFGGEMVGQYGELLWHTNVL